MSVKDKHGVEIEEGSYIIYTNVGTIGKVIDTKVDDEASWVLIEIDEINRLWYNTRYVEVTDEKYAKTVNHDDAEKELNSEEIKNELNRKVSSEMGGDAVGGG